MLRHGAAASAVQAAAEPRCSSRRTDPDAVWTERGAQREREKGCRLLSDGECKHGRREDNLMLPGN